MIEYGYHTDFDDAGGARLYWEPNPDLEPAYEVIPYPIQQALRRSGHWVVVGSSALAEEVRMQKGKGRPFDLLYDGVDPFLNDYALRCLEEGHDLGALTKDLERALAEGRDIRATAEALASQAEMKPTQQLQYVARGIVRMRNVTAGVEGEEAEALLQAGITSYGQRVIKPYLDIVGLAKGPAPKTART